MNTNLKKRSNNKTLTFFTIILVVVIILLLQQYTEWRQNFQDFNNIEYQPVDNASNISTN